MSQNKRQSTEVRKKADEQQKQGEWLETSAFYVPPENISADRVVFPAQEEHHIRNVLRLMAGKRVEVLDGCGGRFSVALEKKIEGRSLEARICSAAPREARARKFSVALAMGRKERLRLAVEKLAELGCFRIVLLKTDYCSFRGSAQKQIDKLRLVAISALKQSGGAFLTRIEGPETLEKVLDRGRRGLLRPVLCRKKPEGLKTDVPGILDQGLEYMVLVGPEGGFSPGEIARLEEFSPLLCIHLGQAALRFETAAIAGFVLLRRAMDDELSLYRAKNI